MIHWIKGSDPLEIPPAVYESGVGVSRSTYPTPLTVCTSGVPPSVSSFFRR